MDGEEGPGHDRVSEAGARPAGAVRPADESGAAVAAEALRRGDVVAVPTDTLYGLAACAKSEQVMFQLVVDIFLEIISSALSY